MNTKRWCIGNTPFRQTPNGLPIMEIPVESLVEVTGNQQKAAVSGQETVWSEIIYKGQRAWVYDAFLEEYVEKYPDPVVQIPNPTPDPTDAEQYMIVEGGVKYNMCGELCIAYITGDDISTFLKKWKAASPVYYNWKLSGTSDKPTLMDVIDNMLQAYGYPVPSLRFEAALKDPIIGIRVSPGRIQSMLGSYYLIAGVHIDRISGKLRGQGFGHWVVVDSVTPNEVNGGWVQLYNPFRNKRQEYSYDEFMNSVGTPRNGVWVKRTQP